MGTLRPMYALQAHLQRPVEGFSIRRNWSFGLEHRPQGLVVQNWCACRPYEEWLDSRHVLRLHGAYAISLRSGLPSYDVRSVGEVF